MGRLMGCLHDRTSCCRAVVISLLICFSGCTGYIMRADRPKGVYHRIKPGETLWSIARAYRVSVQDIAEINNIEKPSQIEANEVLFIPEAKQVIDDAMSSLIKEKTPVEAKAGKPGMKDVEDKTAGREMVKNTGKGAKAKGAETAAPPLAADDKSYGRERTGTGRLREGTPDAEAGYGEEEVAGTGSEGGRGPVETGTRQVVSPKRAEELQFDRKRFVWPVKGSVVSRFGIQPNGMFYNG